MSHWWASQVAEMTQEQQRSSRILKIYGALISSSLVANFICSYLFYWTLLKASERLHNKMMVSVIKARLIYFDKTPVGRTLNRFSKDIGSMDDVLTPQFLTAVETVLFCNEHYTAASSSKHLAYFDCSSSCFSRLLLWTLLFEVIQGNQAIGGHHVQSCVLAHF